ncbi:MAG: MBL fold metallo-hydrolase [Hyphomicrobiales bacterium]|nr:MBL fold metallo-hydrolase [Hyphomicrobiales bacterium]
MTVASSYRCHLGNTTVIALSDGSVDVSLKIVADAPVHEIRDDLIARGLPTEPRVSVNAFAIQVGGRTALVDTGAGGKFAATLGLLPHSLAAVGIAPEAVEAVLLTHMHPDHSSGLTDSQGRPIFVNAEVVLHQDEFAHWMDDARMTQASPRQRRDNFEAARRAIAPYRHRVRLIRDGDVFPGVRALPLPGHTPGHTGYLIGSGADTLLIWGDIVHLPDVQVARPDVAVVLDTDKAAAIATRRRALDIAATERLCVAGMHLHFPGFAKVVRAGKGFTLEPSLHTPT